MGKIKLIGNKHAIHSPEFHARKLREQKLKRYLYALLLLVLVATPIVLLRLQKFQITAVDIAGNEVTKSETVDKIINGDLAGDYLYLIPHSSTIFYPRQRIIDDLFQGIPRIKSLSLALDGLNSLKLSITERTPVALYCGEVSNINAPGGCYFVDLDGFIFSQAPVFSGAVYVAYSTAPPMTNPLGQQFLPAETFQKIKQFVDDLTLLNLEPVVFQIKGDEYNISLSSGTVILLKADADLTQVESNLTSFLNATRGDFLYLDLRFGNKVFYKFKGE